MSMQLINYVSMTTPILYTFTQPANSELTGHCYVVNRLKNWDV